MVNIEKRLEVLTAAFLQLQEEFYRLKTLTYRQQQVYGSLGSNKDVNNRSFILESNLDAPKLELDDNGLSYTPAAGEDSKHLFSPLTLRETQILNGVASGKTNRQMASILGLSEQTVKNHIRSILIKLGAKSRAHAVFLAICHGWLPAEIEREEMVPVS